MTIRHRLARLESRQKQAVDPKALSHFELARRIAFGLECAVHTPTSINAAGETWAEWAGRCLHLLGFRLQADE